MKKVLIVTLVGINAALLLALMLGAGTGRADAQGVLGATTDYLVVTGQITSGWDGVYVIDLRKRYMVAFRFDKTKQKLIPYRGVRKLLLDFKRESE